MSRKLRVLMVSDVYFPRVNGVSTSIETFRHRLHQADIDTTLIAPQYAAESSESADLIRIPSRPVPRDPEDRIMRWRALQQACEKHMPTHDLVHVQTPFLAHYAANAAARRHHKPVVLTYHTLFEEYLQHYVPLVPAALLRSAARSLSRSQCNAVNAVIVPSSAMQQRLLDYGITTPQHILPTGISLERFRPVAPDGFRAAHDIPQNATVALFVGRVAHEKNLDFLIDSTAIAIRQQPNLVLVIAGEGPARAALQSKVTKSGLSANIRFVGYLDRQHELARCYAAADLFVFASRTETQGLVLIEAMACGLPVLALAEMGTRDILKPDSGAIIGQDPLPAFADQLAQLAADPVLRKNLATQAISYSREWSDQAMAERLAVLYHSLAKPRSASNPHQQTARSLHKI